MTPLPKPLTAREIMEQLPMKFFTQLCSVIDNSFGEKVAAQSKSGHGWGGNLYRVGEHIQGVPFDILEIEKTPGKCRVFVQVTEKITETYYWDNLKYCVTPEKPEGQEQQAS